MKLNHIILTGILLLTGAVQAQLQTLDQYRAGRAVVHYDFSVVLDGSGNIEPWIRDKGTFCPTGAAGPCSPAADLVVLNAPNAIRSQGVLQFNGVNLARSAVPATKLYNACKNTGALSVEIELKNFETTIARSGFDLDKRPQPLRIVSFSKDLTYRNFTIGQFYDGGDQYQIGVRTNTNENDPASTNPMQRLGNSFQDPLKSTTSAILIPSSTRPARVPQKLIFTLNKEGVGRLYLSDLDGALYLATENTTGFGAATATNLFKNWITGSYINLGNENLLAASLTNIANSDGSPTTAAKNDFNSKSANGSNLAEDGDKSAGEPNRYWKGELNRVAIYCDEIPRDIVLGAGTQNVIKNIVPTVPVDIAVASLEDPSVSKAQNIYTRLTGVKKAATDPVIIAMTDSVKAGNLIGAAALATSDAQFINTTIRDFAAKMSNRAETINVPLNDFTATFMGIARDDIPATSALTGNFFYMANRDPSVNPRTGVQGGSNWPTAPVPGRFAEDILLSNNHYDSLETGRYDLNAVLVKTRQKVLNTKAASAGGLQAVDMPDPAGVLTTRQWLKEHAFAGTNRRLIEFSLREFLCTPIEMAADAGGADDVVGPDIDRLPGGDNSKYMTTCRSCHTILDSFRPAFAEWSFGKGYPKHVNFTDDIKDTDDEDVLMGMKKDDKYPGVSFKYNKEADTDATKVIYPDGRRTVDTKWVNHALTGSNKVNFQFPDDAISGTGVNSFGQLLASSPKFSKCMAERAFRQVCKRDVTSSDAALINSAALAFSKNKSYNLKVLFQNIVVGDQCLGEAN